MLAGTRVTLTSKSNVFVPLGPHQRKCQPFWLHCKVKVCTNIFV